ncbi:hypothetical protein C1O66_15885 [Paucibacter aquatile]|uniref:diguanylate cyclase n=1 Tax=Kinneretia aquatilis TaxID=2070761 RepID=A0A2N8KZG8_9BURK|nr:GGDEF domain-containing protein [Paucibacter aquatile]PND38858.1 hypothetical protein C1O66_15885 [Paucibacter aquatile]
MKRALHASILGTGLLLGSAWAAQPPQALAAALPSQLDQLVRREDDQLDEVLHALQTLRQELAGTERPGPEQEARIDFAEGMVRLVHGDRIGAQKMADQLALQAGQLTRSQVLRGEIANRDGHLQSTAEWARLALQTLERNCPRQTLKSAVTQQVCDYRLAWTALRLLARTQMAEGAVSAAEAGQKYALELAQAAEDHRRSAFSMATLAMLYQDQSQPELSRRWITLALQTAQGDPQAMGQVKSNEAILAARVGDRKAQRQALDEGLALAREAGSKRLTAQLYIGLNDYYMQVGQPLRALQAAQPVLAMLSSLPDARFERVIRSNMVVTRIQLRQFEQARQELARLRELNQGNTDLVQLSTQLREQGEAWASVGRPREAILAYHEERKLSAQLNARNRESAMQQLRIKYDSERKQRDLNLLVSQQALVDRQLSNRQLASQVSYAVAVLLGLSLLLGGVMVRRMHLANQRLKANELLLRAQSERDPLTDLANRRHFLAVMNEQTQQDFHGALLMVDIDHFKHVNDQHGHGIGDVVICEVARRLSHAVRQGDLVVRWGGEEFLVFASAVTSEQLASLAERILHTVADTPVHSADGPLRITVSLGFAHFPLPPGELPLHWEQAVNWADMALYTAKSRGRNRAMGIAAVRAADRASLESIAADFEAACSNDQVSLQQILGPGAA